MWNERLQPLISDRSVLRPFALRALGAAREDEELLKDAIQSFEALGLGWHAEQTRLLVLQA